jgi:hypothetical protein
MAKVRLTMFSGEYRFVEIPNNKQALSDFVQKLSERLDKSVSVQIECDLFGYSGIVRGNK